MLRFDNIPVSDLKIQLVHGLLNDPTVRALYDAWVRLADTGNATLRNAAFNAYAATRDAYLGLPPLVKQEVAPHNKYRVN